MDLKLKIDKRGVWNKAVLGGGGVGSPIPNVIPAAAVGNLKLRDANVRLCVKVTWLLAKPRNSVFIKAFYGLNLSFVYHIKKKSCFKNLS